MAVTAAVGRVGGGATGVGRVVGVARGAGGKGLGAAEQSEAIGGGGVKLSQHGAGSELNA